MAIITISRQLGSGGNATANRLAKILGYNLIDKTKIHEMVSDYGRFKTELEKIVNEEKPGFMRWLVWEMSLSWAVEDI
jgi:cytidylate kinase